MPLIGWSVALFSLIVTSTGVWIWTASVWLRGRPPAESACPPSSSSTHPLSNLHTCTPTCLCALEEIAISVMTGYQTQTPTCLRDLDGPGRRWKCAPNVLTQEKNQTQHCVTDYGDAVLCGASLGLCPMSTYSTGRLILLLIKVQV